MFEFIQKYDVIILDFLNGLGSPMTDPFWLFITKIYVWIPLFIVMFFFSFRNITKRRAVSIFLIFVVMLAFVLGMTEIVKCSVARIRPCNTVALNGLFRELIHPNDYSFFSGHSATSVSITTYFIILFRKQFKWVYILFLWSGLFMFSRLYLAAHYPSDIITGAAVGFCVGLLFVKLTKLVMKKQIV